ncbi:MAG TPA: glycosyltransferase family 4 protein [Burkholderiales bacterium]|nr:glycosyltransferase family 4 protein [Burkholderiales bacterium]
MEKEILMIGSARGAHSGIASVVNVYFAHGLFRRWRARYLATHADGSRLLKAWLAARSLASLLARLGAGRVALLHVLAASEASVWRKSLFVLCARLFGVPYVLHVHCGRYAGYYERQRPWAQRLIRYQLRHARAVIALSEELREALASIAPESRVISIYNPIPIPAWQASLDAAPPTVLFLGVLKPHKGVSDLLRAWPAVLEAAPQAQLVLGGSGDVDAARALARELGIEHCVELPGWIDGPQKEDLVRRAGALALPSYSEALPMAVLECMAAGVPVVATRIAALPLAVHHGHTGELIEPGDRQGLARALAALLTDAPRRFAMGGAGRQRARDKFSADALLPKLEALWREIAPELERGAPRQTGRWSGRIWQPGNATDR